ncbi:hypothetical protein Bhyg_12198, partial [Pseudolycoriella hygida]
IPKSPTVRHEWLNRIGASNTANGRICSKHFDESDFELKSDGRRWLKPDALPTEVVEEFEDEANEIEVAEVSLNLRKLETAKLCVYCDRNLGQKCIMKSGNLELATENEYESQQQLIIHPSIDIAKHIETSTKTPRMMELQYFERLRRIAENGNNTAEDSNES